MNCGVNFTVVGVQNHSKCNTDTIHNVFSIYELWTVCTKVMSYVTYQYVREIYVIVTDSNEFPSRELENDHTRCKKVMT